jgi:hypothetical protein
VHDPGLLDPELHLTTLGVGDSLGHVHGYRANLRVRHQAARAQDLAQAPDDRHHIRRRDATVEVHLAALDDLHQILGANNIGPCLGRFVSLRTLGEHRDAQRLAGNDGVTGVLSGLKVTDCLVQTCAKIARQGGKPTIALLGSGDFADLCLETEARGRYAKLGATSGNVSFSALEIQTGAGAVPVVADRHTADDNAFILDTRAIELYSAGPVPSLFNEDGSFYHRTEAADTLEFYLFAFYGLSIQDPGGCSWVQDVQ